MDRVGVGPVKGLRIAVAAFVLSVILFVVVIGVALALRSAAVSDTQNFANELREGLINSCARNGNPLREAVQGMLREQIRRSKPATVRRYFPQIPPAELNRLLHEQREATEATIRRIAPVDCASLYPPPNH